MPTRPKQSLQNYSGKAISHAEKHWRCDVVLGTRPHSLSCDVCLNMCDLKEKSISDFLPFLIEVHELGHVVAQSHRRHSTGRIRISIEKNDKMSWVKEQRMVATIVEYWDQDENQNSTTENMERENQSTHMKCVFIASSVAVLGTEHTNRVFLVYKQRKRSVRNRQR